MAVAAKTEDPIYEYNQHDNVTKIKRPLRNIEDLIAVVKIINAKNVDWLLFPALPFERYDFIRKPSGYVRLLFNSLRPEQKEICIDMINIFASKNPAFILINAPPGVGKTYMLSCFCSMITTLNCILVLSATLKLDIGKNSLLNVSTCCKFIMETLHLKYWQQVGVFNKIHDPLASMFEFYRKVKYQPLNAKLLIVEEFTMLNPWFFFIIYLYHKIHKVFVIVCGDKNQQSLSRSTLHGASNKYIIDTIKTKEYKLTEQIRIKDSVINNVLDLIKRNLDLYNKSSELRFPEKLLIFKTFLSKFTLPSRYDENQLYISFLHKKCTDFLRKCLIYAKEKDIFTYEARYRLSFELNDEQIINKPIPIEWDTNTSKFLHFIPLIKGYRYMYTSKTGEKTYVRFVNKVTNHERVSYFKDKVVVQDINTNKMFVVQHETLNSYQVNDILKVYLTSLCQGADKLKITNFPLVPAFICTYMSVQGLTIKDAIINLDLDTKHSNSVYVALSRSEDVKHIGKIYTNTTTLYQLMLNVYIEKFNVLDNNYFYMYSKFISAQQMKVAIETNVEIKPSSYLLAKTEFYETNKIEEFERSTRNVKINKKYYIVEDTSNINDTELMAAFRFFDKHYNALTKFNTSSREINDLYECWKEDHQDKTEELQTLYANQKEQTIQTEMDKLLEEENDDNMDEDYADHGADVNDSCLNSILV